MGRNKKGGKGRVAPAQGGVQKESQQQQSQQQHQVDKNKAHELATLPRKKMYRARAHSNPLSDQLLDVPKAPAHVDWAPLYPSFFPSASQQQQQQQQQQPDPAPSGMGTDSAAELQAVASTSGRDVASLRLEHPGQYGNVSCVRTNAMKYLPNYFEKGQLTKMFFLFPDPHFKAANHRRRIINTTLVTEYAYLLAPGGWLYTITDVEELGNWMRDRLDTHPMFERVSEEELEKDPAAGLLYEATEEGQKVARNKGNTYRAVYRRLAAPRELPANPERLVSRK
ncbi:putative methyltransferase-domain-containing protein [Dunaliella salina]|uniref:tRNA (guanine-N(7)-)-methyltransferase n=1 Tax=Dunaliella salina TaxID=3046 RepID=A0ABQ7H706_DUNSA|nr:putative methyltransferase-domain-containing protein [Dunaliella salina]|eukprot:KAF5842634.1 putative methyltransferase-domain-containing protein [Dunaliella salina]